MELAPALPLVWQTGRGHVELDRPAVVGILNVTPDSFWDGGAHAATDAALHHVERMLEAGADVVDVGGESTRPGASPVGSVEEAARVMPVLSAVSRRWPDLPVSVDTVKSEVATAALEAGAWIINDVSGLRLDDALGDVVAAAGAGLVLMHSRGSIDTMARYETARYGDCVAEVVTELHQAVERALRAGVPRDALVLDPGLGFSKRTEDSLAVVANLDPIVEFGCPVMVGPSRKRFVGEAGGGLPVEDRLEGTLAVCVAALMRGARLFRVHDVGAARRTLDVAHAIVRARTPAH